MVGIENKDESFFLYRATGMSMFPYIRDGEILVVRKTDPDEIECGDIILFSPRALNAKVAHFVGKKYISGGNVFFQTKGGRSALLEEPVGFKQISGKVVALKRGGMVFNLDSPGREHPVYRLSCFWYRCVGIIRRGLFTLRKVA